MEIEVEISDAQGHLRVDRAELVDLARRVLRREGRRRASISIAVVDGATIHALNRTHLGHDWPTDVISFPLSDPDDPVLAGELVVSAERAVAQASELGVQPREELALYLVHGLLHLCGYEDSQEPEAAGMRRRQKELLAEMGFSYSADPIGDDRADREGPADGKDVVVGPFPAGDGGPQTARPICEHRESSPWPG